MLKITAIYDETPGRSLVLCDPNQGDKPRLLAHAASVIMQPKANLRGAYQRGMNRLNRTRQIGFEVTITKPNRRAGVNHFFDFPDQVNGAVLYLIFADGAFVRVLKHTFLNDTSVDPYNVTNVHRYTAIGGELLTSLPDLTGLL
jgi:hypothetical protein